MKWRVTFIHDALLAIDKPEDALTYWFAIEAEFTPYSGSWQIIGDEVDKLLISLYDEFNPNYSEVCEIYLIKLERIDD